MSKPVIIYGNRSLGKMLWMDAQTSNDFKIEAFIVDDAYLNENGLFCGLPQISFSRMLEMFPSEKYDLIVTDGTNLIQNKEPLFLKVKDMGYTIRNYISSKSIVSDDCIMGVNNIVFEQVYIGPNGIIGNNNLIRQQVYLGHDFKIGNHCIFNPGCKIGGFLESGSNVFVGMGAIVIDHIKLKDYSIVGAGSVVIKSTEEYSINVGNPSRNIKGDKHD